jgi:hypothetical protein
MVAVTRDPTILTNSRPPLRAVAVAKVAFLVGQRLVRIEGRWGGGFAVVVSPLLTSCLTVHSALLSDVDMERTSIAGAEGGRMMYAGSMDRAKDRAEQNVLNGVLRSVLKGLRTACQNA